VHRVDVGQPDLGGLAQGLLVLGGTALYLLAHVAFRWRNVHRLRTPRLLCAVVLLALVPAGTELPALATLAIVAALLIVLIAYERVHFAELRQRLRGQLASEAPAD
jgi:hypothetical protein